MLEKVKGILGNLDLLSWEAKDLVTPYDTFQEVTVTVKVGDGYTATATSRRKMQAFGFALRDIAEQIIRENGPR